MISIFSQTLKELRQERNLTQKELAYDLNYTQSNISEWENGTVEPKATALTAISTYFGVSIDYLLGLENEYGARTATTAIPIDETFNYSLEEQNIIKNYRELNQSGKRLINETINKRNDLRTLRERISRERFSRIRRTQGGRA